MDICLVNMPYVDIQTPSMALGLLKGFLNRSGIKSKVIYGNLLFAEDAGMDVMQIIYMGKGRFLGDWLFTDILFPEKNLPAESYIELLPERSDKEKEKLRVFLLQLRKKVKKFLYSLSDIILREKPSITGCTSIFLQHIPSIALLKIIHEKDPSIITLMGGPACETILGLTTHKLFPWIDYVVSGEADDLIVPLVYKILEKGRNITEAELPFGVFSPFHREKGYPSGPPGAVKGSLSGLPYPDYDDYFESLSSCPSLKEIIIPSLPVETSRGCWWAEKKHCTFCGDNGVRHAYRRKPYEEALKEFEYLYNRYKVNRFTATDNMMDLSFLKTFVPSLIHMGSPYRIFYEITAKLKKNDVKNLKDGGIIWIQPGIESLSSKILSMVKKGTESYENIQLLKWCRQYGLWATWNFLHSFPGEKDEWYEEMSDIIPLVTHLQPPRLFNQIHICRNSHYFNSAEDYGLRVKPAGIYSHIFPLSEEILRDFVFSFEEEAIKERDTDPLDNILRCGFYKLKKEIFFWKKLFLSEEKPSLTMSVNGEEIHIEDKRPAALKETFLLKGFEKELYLFCDEGPKKDNLFEVYKDKRNETEEIIQTFIANKLALEIDGRIISLSLYSPLPVLPDMTENPCGYINFKGSL